MDNEQHGLSAALAGKTALVTGAESGIGAHIARTFSNHGATVFAGGLSAPVELADANCLPLALDIADDRAIDTAMATIEHRAGRLDVCFHAAGIHSPQTWGCLQRDDAAHILSVNAVSAMMLIQAVATAMGKSGGGSIICVASIAGRRGYSPVAYSASKAAVINLTQSAALAYAKDGIRVNAIAPGPIDTPMLSRIRASKADTGAFDEAMLGLIPAGRFGTVDDIGGLAVLLASGHARYITGQTINVDGGQLMN